MRRFLSILVSAIHDSRLAVIWKVRKAALSGSGAIRPELCSAGEKYEHQLLPVPEEAPDAVMDFISRYQSGEAPAVSLEHFPEKSKEDELLLL